jgi:tripartite-type tricarboxylate transporter receptor subunit TctC
MKKTLLVLVVLFAVVALSGAQTIDKPVNIVCSFGAGGGTDLVNRALAEGMKAALGVQVNVQNMPGAGGGIAEEYVWQKPRDGLTILGCSETNLMVPANGAHTTTAKDWQYYWAGGSPGVVMVPAKSPFKTFADLVKYAKANPKKLMVAAAVLPGVWSLKWLTVAQAAGIETTILPYSGSAPALTGVLTGEADVLHISVGEARGYLQTGALRALVATEAEAIDTGKLAGRIDPITKYFPSLKSALPMPQLLGIAIPLDTPADVKAQIEKAFLAAMKSEAVMKILDSQMATPFGYAGAKANDLSKAMESKFSWAMKDLGISKVDPATLGIPKP